MYQTLDDLKYFRGNPDAVRRHNYTLAWATLGLAVLALPVIAILSDFNTGGIVLVPLALGLAGVVGLVFARIMPGRTPFGAEEAARWRAFARYLQNIQQYTNLADAAQRFDQYLPYAVALGLDQALVSQFADVAVPVQAPTWYIPAGWHPAPGVPGNGSSPVGANAPVPIASGTSTVINGGTLESAGRAGGGIGPYGLGDPGPHAASAPSTATGAANALN